MKRIIAWMVTLGAVGAVVLWLWPNDERAIRKLLAELGEAVSIHRGQSALGKIAAASGVVDFFTADVTMEIEGVDLRINDRNDLREAILAARARLQVLEVKFEDVHVTVDSEARRAVVYTVALANMDGQTNAMGRALKMQLHKPEKSWIISRVESVAQGQ